MDLVPVKSSNIKAIGWSDSVLHVRFRSGATYEYDAVPEEVYDRLMRADSIGSTFHHTIKMKGYKFKRVTRDREASDIS